MQIQNFNIADLIQSPSALTREQGLIVYDKILPQLNKNNKLVLDFSEIENIITPFLIASIGKLYGIFSSDLLQTLLVVSNLPKSTISKIQIVINNAKYYYENSDNFKNAVLEVIDN